MIYTSYFGNRNNFPKNAYVIGITRFPHAGIQENWDVLAPSAKLLKQFKNKEIDEFVFKIKFLEQLKLVDKDYTIELLKLTEDYWGNVILCCYEKKGDFCHRHIVAEWLDIGIEEL